VSEPTAAPAAALSGVPLGGSRIDRGPGMLRIDARAALWVDDSGAVVSDEPTLWRLRALAIPPAWTSVWASADPDHRVQATGVDARGRTQYRYASAATAFASDQKFDHMLAFADALPALRARVTHDLRAHDDVEPVSATRVIAAIVRLLERGLFRIGNERYARDNHTYGLTTIRRGQLSVAGDTVEFDFVGKEHLRHRITVVDRAAARVVRSLLERPGSSDDEVFVAGAGHPPRSIHSTEVNAYLHAHTGAPATAKVFRTWGATAAAAAIIAGAEPAHAAGVGASVRSTISLESRAVMAAAELLGNTPTVARASYIHPSAFIVGGLGSVALAVDEAAARHGTRQVRVLFGDAAVQSAVLAGLRMSAGTT
jgi:DNA topoisomerase-1